MSTYRLEKLFCPRSITIVGASPRERSLGRSIARNLRAGGFGGPLHIVNPNYEYIDGLSTVTSIEAITEVPDIVVIAVPPAAVPEIVAAAGAKGRGGDHYHRGTESPHRLLLRLVGPNCLGVMALLPRSTSFRPIAEVSCRDEACGSAHHWARELIKLGHDARMMPPAYVKPYVRRQKNDAADAAGICEAVTRPSMRFTGVRTLENQAALMHHKAREMLVAQRTQLINALRGHLAEIGVIAAQGLKNARELARVILAEGDETIPRWR